MLYMLGILQSKRLRIDHLAIAVRNLDQAIARYTQVLGFELLEKRETYGKKTTMRSAVVAAGELVFVLLEGGQRDSQVTRFIAAHGPGVQHVALQVEDIHAVTNSLKETGQEFASRVVSSPHLKQIFTVRDPASGIMLEFIERLSPAGRFTDEGVQELFEDMEAAGAY